MLIYSFKNYKIFYQKIFKHEKIDDSLSKSSQQRQNIIVKRKIVKFVKMIVMMNVFGISAANIAHKKVLKVIFVF